MENILEYVNPKKVGGKRKVSLETTGVILSFLYDAGEKGLTSKELVQKAGVSDTTVICALEAVKEGFLKKVRNTKQGMAWIYSLRSLTDEPYIPEPPRESPMARFINPQKLRNISINRACIILEALHVAGEKGLTTSDIAWIVKTTPKTIVTNIKNLRKGLISYGVKLVRKWDGPGNSVSYSLILEQPLNPSPPQNNRDLDRHFLDSESGIITKDEEYHILNALYQGRCFSGPKGASSWFVNNQDKVYVLAALLRSAHPETPPPPTYPDRSEEVEQLKEEIASKDTFIFGMGQEVAGMRKQVKDLLDNLQAMNGASEKMNKNMGELKEGLVRANQDIDSYKQEIASHLETLQEKKAFINAQNGIINAWRHMATLWKMKAGGCDPWELSDIIPLSIRKEVFEQNRTDFIALFGENDLDFIQLEEEDL